jgi:hypothetical protein
VEIDAKGERNEVGDGNQGELACGLSNIYIAYLLCLSLIMFYIAKIIELCCFELCLNS